MNLTKNFTLSEFTRSQTALRRGISNEPNAEHLANMIALCKHIMQPIRDGLGAVIITSGYRSPALNEAIGGSTTSQHSLGQAADFGVVGMTPKQVCQWIIDQKLPFDQLIYEGTWVHVSYGPRNRRQVLTAHFGKVKTTYTNGIA